MTKSKKLISVLLAFVMLVTSCSLSFFAFAADTDVAEANELAEAALGAFTDGKTVTTADQTFIDKLNTLTDAERLEVNPAYYAYALHIATTKVLNDSNPTAAKRATKLSAYANGDATTVAAYNAYLTVPADYVTVIKDLVAANAKLTVNGSNVYLVTSVSKYLEFSDATAKAQFETFWNKYKNYSYEQRLFADVVPGATSAISDMFQATHATNVLKKKTAYDNNAHSSVEYLKKLNYYFGTKGAETFAEEYFRYKTGYFTADVSKKKYINKNAWIDSANGPTNYYNELKTYFTNLNANTKAFYVDYLTALSSTSEYYEGLENIGTIIDVGLALNAGETVPFAQVKDAYEKYDALKDPAKALIYLISYKLDSVARFNAEIKSNSNIKFGDGEDTASISYLASNTSEPSSNALTYADGTGDTIQSLIALIISTYDANNGIEAYRALLAEKLADESAIQPSDCEEVWEAFNELSDTDKAAVRDTEEDWNNTVKVMVAPFVNYVDGVNLAEATAADATQSTTLLENTVEEFKTLLTEDDAYKTIYEKYLQIQIAEFRAYVEGVDLDNVTAENRTTAESLYTNLEDEYKAVVQDDEALYAKYIAIISSEFKEYIEAIDLDNVDDSVRSEAQKKYQALSDDAKKNAYEDEALWAKYCQIQVPGVDSDTHSEEAAKTADKETLPTTSEAINDLGIVKSIDNVEDFVIDDVLPLVTDQIKIDDKNDVVNSALEQHLTNETVGKIYSLYASLSHNQTEIDGVKVGTLVQTQLIPKESLVVRLYEDEFAGAKAKIYNAIATNAIPTDENGDIEELDIIIGYDYKDNPIYEQANIYDGIAAIEFENGDFGFEDGDRDGFVKALLAVLRPITGICAPGSPLGIEFFNHVDKNTGAYTFGIYECCLSLLEALGVTGLPSDEEYMVNYYTVLQTTYATAEGTEDEKNTKAASIAGDEYLKPIINGVLAFADSELKTITDILALIPRLGDIIQSDIPSTIYKNLHADLGMLSGLIETIDFNGTEIPLESILNKYVLQIAIFTYINTALSDYGIVLNVPDWDELNKYTTFKVNKSAQKDKDYVAVRYINGDTMFTELIYYAYDNLIADDDNAAALKDTLGGIPLVGSNIAPLVDNAKAAGKLDTYAAILDYFYETEEEKNKDATADAGKSIGDAISGINDQLNFSTIDCSKAVVKVSKKKFNYNGKIQKPSVTVTLNGEKLVKGIAYKVSYSNASSKKIGSYKVTVTFIGNYEGDAKTYKYTIGPKNARKLKATAKKGAIKVSWKKSASKSAKGYVIQYSANKSFKNAKTVTVKGRSKTSKTISGLTSGTKYYVRIKSYAVKSGKKIYSAYSAKKAATVK